MGKLSSQRMDAPEQVIVSAFLADCRNRADRGITALDSLIEVTELPGELVYDSGVIAQPEITWSLQNGNGEEKKDEKTAKAELAVAGAGIPGRIAKFISDEEIVGSEISESNGLVGVGTPGPHSRLHILAGPDDNSPPRFESTAATICRAHQELDT